MTDPAPFPTVSMHIECIRPIAIGGTHTVRGTVVRAGKRVTVVDATDAVRDEALREHLTTTLSWELG